MRIVHGIGIAMPLTAFRNSLLVGFYDLSTPKIVLELVSSFLLTTLFSPLILSAFHLSDPDETCYICLLN